MRSLLFGFVLILAASCQSTQTKETGKPFFSEKHIEFEKWGRTPECCTAKGKKVAIASGGSNASRAGLEIFDQGGNIIDAAVAVAFCLAVERPHSAGIGGGGFMTLHLEDTKEKDFFVDFRETAPARATEKMFLDKDGKVIPHLSVQGPLSIATPGFVVGLYDIHKKWGKLPWKKVLQPAYRLAKEGFPVYPSLARHIEHDEMVAKDPYTKSLLYKNGAPLKTGDLFVQTDLAKTIQLIAEKGKDVFSKGEIAKKIVATIKEKGGIVGAKDLSTYVERYQTPIHGTFKDFTFVSSPPPSAGGVLMAEMLNVLSGFDLTEISKSPPQYFHLLGEVMKRAYADRSQYIGDPDYFKAPYEQLTTMEYAKKMREALNLSKSTPSKEIHGGEFSIPEKQHTTHLSLIDDKGNAVSSTITINTEFGAGFAVPGTGIFMNDEMDDFTAKPGDKNVYSLTSMGEANAIQPGKRPVSSMMPTIFLKDGKPVLVVGGAGGSRIISSVTQVSLNYLTVFPGDLRKSLFAPRMHHQWDPDKLSLEGELYDELGNSLKEKGNDIIKPRWSGIVQGVARSVDGETTAVFDPRDEGGAEAQ